MSNACPNDILAIELVGELAGLLTLGSNQGGETETLMIDATHLKTHPAAFSHALTKRGEP